MLGTLGVQEMVVIILVALVLFGPKKLPELGRTIGKALTEFRRATRI
jgi:sec-independent protein translocase protein TatA